MLKAVGLLVSIGPIKTEYIHQEALCEAVASDHRFGAISPVTGQEDLFVIVHRDQTVPSHAVQRRGDCWRRHIQGLSKARSNNRSPLGAQRVDAEEIIFDRR